MEAVRGNVTKKSQVYVTTPNCPCLNTGLICMRRERPRCEYIYYNNIVWFFPNTGLGSLEATMTNYKWESLEHDIAAPLPTIQDIQKWDDEQLRMVYRLIFVQNLDPSLGEPREMIDGYMSDVKSEYEKRF